MVTRRYEYLCDGEGLWLLGQSSEGVYVYDDEEDPYSIDFSYEAPALWLPADLEVGSSWTTDYQGLVTYEDGSSSTYTASVEHEAVAEESIEVPAGSFTALRIEGYNEGSPYSTRWHAEDAGLLLQNYLELTSYTP